jgi:hypothetical protein
MFEVRDDDGELVAAEAGDAGARGAAAVTAARNRSATSVSSTSPLEWPSESLTFLKRSMSRKRSAIGLSTRRQRSIALSICSRKSSRFGRPVSASK